MTHDATYDKRTGQLENPLLQKVQLQQHQRLSQQRLSQQRLSQQRQSQQRQQRPLPSRQHPNPSIVTTLLDRAPDVDFPAPTNFVGGASALRLPASASKASTTSLDIGSDVSQFSSAPSFMDWKPSSPAKRSGSMANFPVDFFVAMHTCKRFKLCFRHSSLRI